MRVKKHSDVTSWTFVIVDPEGKEVSMPAVGAPNLSQLMKIVLSHIAVYDEATGGEYSAEQRRLAEEEGLTFEAYMAKVVEHQFCLRMGGRIPCWNDGYGDKVHNKLKKVDTYIAQATPFLRDKLQMAVAKITPSKKKTFSNCAVCGGTFAFNPQVDNLGRAGKLNKLGGKEG